jgi:hypothetical protein
MQQHRLRFCAIKANNINNNDYDNDDFVGIDLSF